MGSMLMLIVDDVVVLGLLGMFAVGRSLRYRPLGEVCHCCLFGVWFR